MSLELHSEAELKAHLGARRDLRNVVVQGLDLTAWAAPLESVAVEGAVFLGCILAPTTLVYCQRAGALVFPRLTPGPYDPYRPRLYSPEELFDRFDPDDPCSYCDCLDARVYRHWEQTGRAAPPSILETLARRLHDHAITDAMEEFLHAPATPKKVVAIMGGHGMYRDDPAYREIVIMARRLTASGYLVSSGGGPGAMEAAHLGAWLVGRDDDAVDRALELLAPAPSYKDRDWLARAFRVRDALPCDRECAISLAIPTWLYGHEPPNPFASHVAKYFANSVREEGLVSIARHGIVFAPGSAGTVQEIFQDYCQNHYATTGERSPMVFLGRDYWTVRRPVMPLIRAMADGPRDDLIAVVDSADDAVDFLSAHPPVAVEGGGWSFCREHCNHPE